MTTIAAQLDALERKRWATLQAELALAGFRADAIEADDGRPQFIVSRWSLTRAFDDLNSLEAFARRVETKA